MKITLYKIVTLPGDGIGPEVMAAAVSILEMLAESKGKIAFEFKELPVGDELKVRTGIAMPPGTVEAVRESDAALFAAVGETAKEVILPLRQELKLYANVRPTKVYPNVPSLREEVDIVMVRENTEGLYKMLGYRGPDWGLNLRIITRQASERIARFAFEYASKNNRSKVTSVHKNNVLDLTCGVFLEACRRIAESYPDMEYQEMIVDACAMKLLLNPGQFDVLVTTNMFGDILSDEAAAIVGGLGMAPSGNIGENCSIFEPVHGSAPDIAGKGIANPIAMILSASMMLEWLGEIEFAKSIDNAVIGVLKEAKTLTPDLGGEATTKQVAAAIAEKIV
ncbi:isocitrate dehydrogenase [Candidatus Bathyarchaeota archaeon]|nr:isocitrate dehydrogenase [Candidatus Bathyarchaeota archaeon]MDP6049251.1 isocitrate/isopropylmalate dehydrogenase family protein [Candidatus Bathyarchaeota archaeon]